MSLIQNKNFNHSILSQEKYEETTLKDVFIKFTKINNIIFFDCNFVNVDFGSTDIIGCEFIDCNFSNCELFHTNFKDNIFKKRQWI